MLIFMLSVSGVFADDLLPVWNFDDGILTDQGGYYNQFESGESTASIRLTRDARRGAGGRGMQIDYTKSADGYCGVWLHTFDEGQAVDDREYLDVFEHPFLSFWAKGKVGGEDFTIQMADAEWVKKEDSKAAGLVSKYLGAPLSTNWQEVVVPYDDFLLATPQAGAVTFNFTLSGKGTVYIDDINFKKRADIVTPETAVGAEEVLLQKKLVRAMWVWNIKALLLDAAYRAEFFDFCRKQQINELFLQIPYRFVNDLTDDVECVLQYEEQLRAFLAEARGKGVLCHALDGYPEFALRPHHRRVLAQVRAILAFNDTSKPEERFYGIHLDNEPYQILGFEGSQCENILEQYLEVNQKAVQLIKEHGSDVVYGVDIPFWFDEGESGVELKTMVTFGGARKNAAEHIIDICDNVGIMDYRNFAGGADGMIRHGQGEIEYAEKVGKKVYLGMETFKYKPTKVYFLYGMDEAKWRGLQDSKEGFLLSSTVGDYHVRTMKAGAVRLVGLAQKGIHEDDPAFRTALGKLYALYGATTHDKEADISKMSFDAEFAVSKDGRYEGFEPFEWKNDSGEITACGFRTIELMLEKITFAGMKKSDLEAVMQETAEVYRGHDAFIGFAIHFYDTYRRMAD